MSARPVANKANSLGRESIYGDRALQSGSPKRIRWDKRFRSDVAARELMVSPVVTARPEYSVERAARLIAESDCGAIPVVDGSGRLIGIITTSDITSKLIARGRSVEHAQVSDCMTEQAFACPADNSVETCMLAMSWHQVKRLPIVDHDHRVVGMICKRDLARYVCEHAGGNGRVAIADVLWALA